MKPLLTATATEATDEQLVTAAREGSDEAFEALFRRYRDRVVGYVRGMVSDHGRAEDIVQEAFMSALRALRRSDREIVFRPWIFEIAKNACIDHLRRARRAQEVSIDSDDFSPAEEGRISQASAGTDATVARRHELESLRMAFHDLPRSQHQILVMRELEGLSYDSIGNRMGLTRGAVESMLFRARRRLRIGFDEIDTGARCQITRATMEAVADGSARARERRRVASHLHDCKSCRQAAVALGLDSLALGAARGPLHRAAALLPLPAFLRRRLEDPGLLTPAAQVGAEHGQTIAAKAAAVFVAAAVCVGGAGVANKAANGELPLVGGSSEASGSARAGEGGPGGPGANGAAGGQGFDNAGQAVAGGTFAPGVPGAAGGRGQALVPGPGGVVGLGPGAPTGTVPGGEAVGALGGTATDAVEHVAKGDPSSTVKTLGDTVEQAPANVKKRVKAEQKALDNAAKKAVPTLDGVKEKAPKIKLKKPTDAGAISPPVELPGTQLPSAPTDLTVPTVPPLSGLGL